VIYCTNAYYAFITKANFDGRINLQKAEDPPGAKTMESTVLSDFNKGLDNCPTDWFLV
jgi:hypothetical protein